MRRAIAFAFSFAVLCALSAGTSTAAAALPADDRFGSARDFIRDEMAREDIPSVAVAVAHRGDIVWEQGFGWADRERRIPASEHTVYLLASISKPFAATALMTLVEQGRIDLDRPVNDYLGEARLTARVGDARDATVRRVTNHTAGLPIHYDFYFSDETDPRRDRDATIRRYGNITVPPGERFEYSNLGFGVLDRVISRISGLPYAEFMRREVFQPLGLTHTSVDRVPELAAFQSTGYDADGAPIPHYVSDDDGGASTVHSSAHDLVRFGLFQLGHLQRGQRRILTDASLELMHTTTTPTVPGEGYALGWRTQERSGGRRLVYHRGGSPGASTLLWLVPDEDLVIVVLTNSRSGREPFIADQVARSLLADWPEPPPAAADPGPAPALPEVLRGDWAGTLHTYERDLPISIHVAEAGEVTVQLDGQAPMPLNRASFRDGWLRGWWPGSIGTADARPRGEPALQLFARLRAGRLIGSVSATSQGMRANSLSHWVELSPRSGDGDAFGGDASDAGNGR